MVGGDGSSSVMGFVCGVMVVGRCYWVDVVGGLYWVVGQFMSDDEFT